MQMLETVDIVFDCDGTLSYGGGLYPGISELLFRLYERGAKLFVWTALGRAALYRLLRDEGVIQLFTEFSCYGECSPKPSADGIEKLLGKPDSNRLYIVVGDRHRDMVGGKQYGASTILAHWDSCEHSDEADFIAKNVSELEDLIMKIIEKR